MFASTNVECVECDLLDPAAPLESVLGGCDVIFNCAGDLHNERLMEPLHVGATLRMLRSFKRLALESGRPLHWVQLSSVGAYGPAVGKPAAERCVTETTSPAPVGTYEITKARADELVVREAENGALTYSILRPSNVFGRGMPNDSIRQWARFIKRRLFVYVGAPGAIATYVHADDVVSALMLCGFDHRARGHVFNLSADCHQEDLVLAMARALDVPPPRLRVPEALMRALASILSKFGHFPISTSRIDALVARTRYPTAKLESVLGYRPGHDVPQSIAEVILDDDTFR